METKEKKPFYAQILSRELLIAFGVLIVLTIVLLFIAKGMLGFLA